MSSEDQIRDFLATLSVEESEENVELTRKFVKTMLVANKKYPEHMPARFGDYTVKVTSVGRVPRWRSKHYDFLNVHGLQTEVLKKYGGRAHLSIGISKDDIFVEVFVSIRYTTDIKADTMTISNVYGAANVPALVYCETIELLKAAAAYCRAHTFVRNVSLDEYDMETDLLKPYSSPKRQRTE